MARVGNGVAPGRVRAHRVAVVNLLMRDAQFPEFAARYRLRATRPYDPCLQPASCNASARPRSFRCYLLALPLPLRPETWTTPQFNYPFGQVFTEHNPAPSPSGHPLLSGPPT